MNLRCAHCGIKAQVVTKVERGQEIEFTCDHCGKQTKKTIFEVI